MTFPDDVALLAVRVAGVATGVGYVVMMFAYFRSGPARAADRVMSASVLVAAAAQYTAFLTADDVTPVRTGVGLGLLAVSNVLFWSARVAHGPTRPAAVFGGEVPPAVVRSGPYRVVRHPFYLAYVLCFAAVAAVGGRWWQFPLAAAVFVLYNAAARQEEEAMLGSPEVSAEYAAYRRRSWRWVPLVW